MSPRRAQRVWDSVALSSTPSIALFKETEVALCAAGVSFDLTGLPDGEVAEADARDIVDCYPRMNFKEQICRLFRHLVEVRPEATYDSFLRDFGERFIPGYEAPSMVDLIASARFTE